MEIFAGDDDGGIPMGGVVRSIEEALMEYDIDTRTCLARTMCNQYQTKLEEEENVLSKPVTDDNLNIDFLLAAKSEANSGESVLAAVGVKADVDASELDVDGFKAGVVSGSKLVQVLEDEEEASASCCK